MCEVLVRVRDKVNEDFYRDTKCTKRGDVIVVAPDGWPWGNDELTLPFWRIVKLPNISVSEASTLLAPEVDTDPANPSKTLQRRAFKLDLSNVNLPQAVIDFLKDGTRSSPSITLNVGVAGFRALKVQKQPVADPAVIG
jgi:hypothetical protein